MASLLEKNLKAQRSAHDLKRLFVESVTRLFAKHLYRFDKYELLDCMLQAVLVDHFALDHLKNGRQVPEGAQAAVNELVRLYFDAVDSAPAFLDLLGPLYMEHQPTRQVAYSRPDRGRWLGVWR